MLSPSPPLLFNQWFGPMLKMPSSNSESQTYATCINATRTMTTLASNSSEV